MSLSPQDLSALLQGAHQWALKASAAIMEVYRRECQVHNKADHSPLTEADLAAHHILDHGLKTLEPRFPVLSEESSPRVFEDRKRWKRFWLIDPLDGTKEFLSKNGEFTVNIALIEEGIPVIGVIYVPALGFGALAQRGVGTRRVDATGERALHCGKFDPSKPPRVAVSRSHFCADMSRTIEVLEPFDAVSQGSALKFIGLADGSMDVYPRLANTSCEWDIAAGHCVVEAAGGLVCDQQGNSLRFNQSDQLKVQAFVACADPAQQWHQKLIW